MWHVSVITKNYMVCYSNKNILGQSISSKQLMRQIYGLESRVESLSKNLVSIISPLKISSLDIFQNNFFSLTTFGVGYSSLYLPDSGYMLIIIELYSYKILPYKLNKESENKNKYFVSQYNFFFNHFLINPRPQRNEE